MGAAVRQTWLIITPEFPPGSGGVGDYTALVAARLAELGDTVRVFTRSPAAHASAPGVEVELLPDDFGPRTRTLLGARFAELTRDAVVLVQYVPHGFGHRGMNLAFARWLGRRPERRFLMVHEAVYPFSRQHPPQRWVLALATRGMLRLATRGAERVFVSAPAWESFVERWGLAPGHPEWLPIPATLAADPEALVPADDGLSVPRTVAHFGTYGELLEQPLRDVLLPLAARHADLNIVLLGRRSERFRDRLVAVDATLAPRVRAAGESEPSLVARELWAAGAVLFPFIEGATTRRTSLMAALAVGAAVVTTQGGYSELLWRTSGAVSLYPYNRADLGREAVERLLSDPTARAAQRQRARTLYRERFHLERVVQRLRCLHAAGGALESGPRSHA
jgi:glycosyltransferase involved in cell wall biosynthesis